MIDAREQFAAFRDMDARGEELVAIYHSHPVSQPYPSPTDRAEAHYPDAFYVLVSLRTGVAEVHAYRITDGFVREVPIRARRAFFGHLAFVFGLLGVVVALGRVAMRGRRHQR